MASYTHTHSELLWTNPSPNASFAAQTISLDLSSYKSITVVALGASNTAMYVTQVLVKGFRTIVTGYIGSTGGTVIGRRDFTWNDNGLVCSQGLASTSIPSSSTNNTLVIPYKIYGVK